MWNQLKTLILLTALSGLMLFMGSLLGGTAGLHIALILSLIMNGIMYFFSDKIVLSIYGAKPLSHEKYGNIHGIVEELARTMNIPKPKLWIIDTPMANAFATGRNPSNASVAVTTGILSILDEHELRGVLAHELAHVKNRDILVTTIAATLATTIGYLADMIYHFALIASVKKDDQENQSNPLIIFLVSLLMPLAASLIQLAISRSREYLADESGARDCRDPLALASALEKLDGSIKTAHLDPENNVEKTTASLFIVHPFSNGSASWLLTIFSTHPPMKKRVARLRAMVGQRR